VGLEGDVVKTLQSIKKGIDLLDSRRADLRADTDDGTGTAEPPYGEYDDAESNQEEDASLPVRR
jgi:hypothetical protein